jgi:hypothetical protein
VWSAETVLVCALTLLSRPIASFPPIQLVGSRPAYVSSQADAYVLEHEPRIYLLTNSASFLRARRADSRCGDLQALRKIASVLVHEEWHVRHGGDEAAAYAAQLTTLASLNAGPGTSLYAGVVKAMQAVAREGRQSSSHLR